MQMYNTYREKYIQWDRVCMPVSGENETSAPKTGSGWNDYLRIQVFLLSSTSMGKISRRPASISKQSTSLEKAL